MRYREDGSRKQRWHRSGSSQAVPVTFLLDLQAAVTEHVPLSCLVAFLVAPPTDIPGWSDGFDGKAAQRDLAALLLQATYVGAPFLAAAAIVVHVSPAKHPVGCRVLNIPLLARALDHADSAGQPRAHLQPEPTPNTSGKDTA